MSSEKKCCVPGCSEKIGSRAVLHLFPNPVKDVDRFITWIFNIGGDILSYSNEYIYKNRRVCHDHFESKYCCRYNRISNIAVPTLNLPELSHLKLGTSSVRKPLRSIENVENSVPSTSKACQHDSVSVTSSIESEQVKDSLLTETKRSFAVSQQDTVDQKTCQHDCLPVTPSIESEQVKDSLLTETKRSLVVSQQDNVDQKRHRTLKRVSILKSKLTKTELNLHKTLLAVKAKLSKYKNKSKKQAVALKKAKKIFTNARFIRALENMPNTGRLITLMQFRESRKKDKGRRFSEEEKLVALTIMKQSPKAYRFLRKMLILPSPQTLGNLLSQCNIGAGINKNVFAQLKSRTQKMTEEERLCLLIFDEMSLKPNLSYSQKRDTVSGFIVNMEETRPIFADHAQVFMVRGLIKNYKQPVAFTYSSGATSSSELASQIETVVKELQEAGFKVLATICDQGANNRSAIQILINKTKRQYLMRGEIPKENLMEVNGQELIPLYDPPHLLKGLRNNLLTKDLKFEINGEKKIAKWEHIEMFLQENPSYKGIRLVPKLTENHVDRNKIGKMKVKYAAQVFSQTVASNMGYLADKKILPNQCKDTADLLLFVDELFDSVNGSFSNKKRHAKPLLQAVTPNSIHHRKWSEFRKVLNTMKFYKNDSQKCQNVPTLKNWVWTLEGNHILIKKLQNDLSINSIWMRHLNQDPLENFFGAIRSHGCRNVNPTPAAFQAAYAALLINSISSVHAPGANCQKDYCEALVKLVSNKDCEANSETYIDLNKIMNINILTLEEKSDPKIMGPLQYVSGYVINKSKKIFTNCNVCNHDLIDNKEIEYIKYREYSNKRWLCSPTKSVINLFSAFQDIINQELKENLEMKNISQYLKTLIYTLVDFSFIKCDRHKEKLQDYLINLSIKFFIFNYCKCINKILTGMQETIDDTDKYQLMAKNYCKKHCKRPRS